MALYEYRCDSCDLLFDRLKPMRECSDKQECPRCGQSSSRRFSTFYDKWPWILTEASHHVGAKDEWVQDRPSNDMIVDNTKAPYTKTLF